MKITAKRLIVALLAAVVLFSAFLPVSASANTVEEAKIQLPDATAVITVKNADSDVEYGETPEGLPCYFFYLPKDGSVIFDQQVYLYGYRDGTLITQNVPANTVAAPGGDSVTFEVIVKKDGTLIKNAGEFAKRADTAACAGIFVFGVKDIKKWPEPTDKYQLASFAPGKWAEKHAASSNGALSSAKIKLPGASSVMTLTNVKNQVGYQTVNGVTSYYFYLTDKNASVAFDQDVYILMQLDKEVGTWSAKKDEKGIVYESTKQKYKDLILYASILEDGRYTMTRDEAGKAAKKATAVILFDSVPGVYDALPKLPISKFAP
ncbi:MAG: hypothetical protein K6F53_11650 [Lachnospiraceae bacterium]|nr:hypothetical protein [Lachnospiraceae bacterium]